MGSIFHEARLFYLKLPVSLTRYRDCSISGKKEWIALFRVKKKETNLKLKN